MLLATDQLLHADQMLRRGALHLQPLKHAEQQHGTLGEDALGIGVQRLCKIAIVGINLAQSALMRRPDLPAGGHQYGDPDYQQQTGRQLRIALGSQNFAHAITTGDAGLPLLLSTPHLDIPLIVNLARAALLHCLLFPCSDWTGLDGFSTIS